MSRALPVTDVDPTRLRYRWVMLAGLWGVYAAFGLVSGSLAPVITPMIDDLGLSRASMGSILGAWPLVYLAVAIPAGALVDRFGLARSLLAGATVVAVSGGLRALAQDYLTLFVAVAVFGIGGPLISIGAPKLISLWFDEADRGSAMGLYIAAPRVGQIVALASANSVLMPATGGSWRATLACFAALAVVAGVVWAFVARRSPVTEEDVSRAASGSGPPAGRLALLRVPLVRTVLVATLGSFFFAHAIGNWLVEVLRDKGFSASDAGFWAAAPTVVGLVAAVVIPRKALPRRRIPMLAVLFVAGAAGTVMVVADRGLLLGVLLLGITRASASPVIMLLLMAAPRVGAANMGAAGGLYFTAGELGGVLGPLLTGVLADATGGFDAPLLLIAGILVGLAVLTVTVLRNQATASALTGGAS